MLPICSGIPQDNGGVEGAGGFSFWEENKLVNQELDGQEFHSKKLKYGKFCTLGLKVAAAVISLNKSEFCFLFFLFFLK